MDSSLSPFIDNTVRIAGYGFSFHHQRGASGFSTG